MIRFLTQKDIDWWREAYKNYEIIPHPDLRNGPVLKTKSKNSETIWMCAEVEDGSWLWYGPEEFKQHYTEAPFLQEPDFDLEDMELAEIIMDEMK